MLPQRRPGSRLTFLGSQCIWFCFPHKRLQCFGGSVGPARRWVVRIWIKISGARIEIETSVVLEWGYMWDGAGRKMLWRRCPVCKHLGDFWRVCLVQQYLILSNKDTILVSFPCLDCSLDRNLDSPFMIVHRPSRDKVIGLP